MQKKILAILLLTAAVLIALAALSDPTIRYPFMGVQLERDLDALSGTDPMTVMLSVETGTELLPEDELTADPAIQDEYTLLMILREDFQAQQKSAAVNYSVEEMQSEQWAWKEAKLKELKAATLVYPDALADPPKLTVEKESLMASSEVWTPLITSFWPKLPTGFQKAGKSTWQEQLSVQEKSPLNDELIKVNYNLVYKLDKFVDTNQGLLANIVIVGSITEGSEVNETIEVRGTFKGFVLIEPATGRAYGGEYRIDEKFMVKQPGLPVLRRSTFQGARFWRPMFYKMTQEKVDTSGGPAKPGTVNQEGSAE